MSIHSVCGQGCICQIFTGGSEFRLATSDYSGHGGCQIGLARKWNRGVLRGLESTPPKRFWRTFWGSATSCRGVKPPDPRQIQPCLWGTSMDAMQRSPFTLASSKRQKRLLSHSGIAVNAESSLSTYL